MKVGKFGAILLAGALLTTPVVTTAAMAESSAEETTQLDYTVTIDGKEADPDNLGYSGIEHTIKITLKKGENDITGAYVYFNTNDLNGLHNCVVDVKYDIPCSIKIAEDKTTWSESSGSNWSVSSGGVETDENNKVKDVSGDLDFWCDFSMMPYGWNVAGFKTTKDKGEGTASFTLNPDHTKDDPNESVDTSWYIRAGVNWTETDKTEGTIELTVKETDKIENIEDPTGNLVIDGTTLTGVTEQGKNAKKIIIPDGVKLIIPGAFLDCKATEISIPNSITYFIAGGFSALSTFEGSNFKSITIPDSMTSICSYAFNGCVKLENITIGKNVTDIESEAFYYCTSLKSITIPDNVKKVDVGAFRDCTNLESVIIGNGVTSLGVNTYDIAVRGVFDGCTNLKTVTIGDSVEGFDTGIAFTGCTSLESINVSEKNNYFSSSDGILFNKDKTVLIKYPAAKTETSYTIPDSVTAIDSFAFGYNKNLKSVYIHKNVTEFSSSVFGENENLTDVYYEGTQEQLTKALGEYTLENVFRKAAIHYNYIAPSEYVGEPTNITVSADNGVVESGAVLTVTVVSETDANSSTFEISFVKDGKEVEPKGAVTVKIPVPEKMKNKNVYVYRAETDGTYTDMNAEVDGDFIVFKTTHFSKYVVTSDGTLADTGSTDDEDEDYDTDDTDDDDTDTVTNPSDSSQSNADKSPETGFAGGIVFGMVALTGAAIVAAKKKS